MLPLEPAPASCALGGNFVTVCRCTQTNATTIVPTNNFLYCPVSNVRVTDAKTCDFLQAVVEKCLDSSSIQVPQVWLKVLGCVYVCMVGVHACVCTCVYAYVHAHVAHASGNQWLTLGLGFFLNLSLLYILRQSFSFEPRAC